jgi:hypothetical protein
LLAQLEAIEELAIYHPLKSQEEEYNATVNPVAIELSFPESLKRQQLAKIKLLLKTLD